MFKLVVLSALLALVAARPSLLAPTIYSSAVVGSVPTSISHQSSSVVHSAGLPVLAHAAPYYAASPIVSSYAASPLVSSYASPVLSSYAAAPIISGYGHGAPLLW